MWNSEDGTLEVGLPGGNVILQIGQETVIKVKAGENLTNGQAVYFSGASGDRPIAWKADNRSINTAYVAGITTENINKNNNGYVTLTGLIRDINTNNLTCGLPVWLSTGGTYTNTMPDAPNTTVFIGYCTRQSATEGILVARPVLVPRMQALSDVNGTPLSASGQFMVWDNVNKYFDADYNINDYTKNINDKTKDPTGFVNPATTYISFDETSKTITLSANVEAYYQGELIPELVDGWVSPPITGATTNGWFLYYNGNDFIWSQTSWTFDKLQIGYVKFTSSGQYLFALHETHGLSMDWATHQELHQTIGTYRTSGGGLTDYTLNSTIDKQPDILYVPGGGR